MPGDPRPRQFDLHAFASRRRLTPTQELILAVYYALEGRMSALDDSVTALTTEIDRVLTDVVQSLKDQLAQAQADDASAAEVAADVQENISKLDDLRTKVASFDTPAEPAPDEPTA